MAPHGEIPRVDSRGLDFTALDRITPEEVQAFRESYRPEDGSPQSGFDYLIDHNPAALKTYRYFATQVQPPYRNARYQAALRSGFTKAQVEEGLALAFMVGGTRALVTIGRALRGFQWPESVRCRA